MAEYSQRIDRQMGPIVNLRHRHFLKELDFAPAAIAVLERTVAGPPRLGVRFLGLLGPQGPMPLHFTEYVRDRLQHHGDRALAHFLDLFHHRLLSLFYRAWAQAQPVVHRDRPQDNRYAAWLRAAAGLPPTSTVSMSTVGITISLAGMAMT